MATVLERSLPERTGKKSESLEHLIRELTELCSRSRDGERLPTRAQLMESYGASERTVLRALDALERSNKIVRKQGWGVFVSHPAGTSTEGGIVEAAQIPAFLKSSVTTRTGTIGMTAFLNEASMETETATLATVRAIESESVALGIKPVFLNRWRANAPELSPAHSIRELLEQGVDSVIVVDIYTHPYVLDELGGMSDLTELPVVYVSNVDHYVPCAHVSFDNRDSGFRAAELLINAGHKSITFLSPYCGRWVDLRAEGARIACERNGINIPFRVYPTEGHVLVNAEKSREKAAEVVQQMIQSAEVLGGIVASHDRNAIDLIQEAHKYGLVAGRDFGLVGFDDDPLAFTMGLSSMRPPYEAMGTEAVRVAAACLVEGSWNRTVNLRADVMARKTHFYSASDIQIGI